MKPYEIFLNNNSSINKLLEIYLELRLHFKELGFSEKDLERPPTHTEKMMSLFHKFGDTQKALFQQVIDYGFDISWGEFIKYITPLMEKINEITPLNDGNYKRRN